MLLSHLPVNGQESNNIQLPRPALFSCIHVGTLIQVSCLFLPRLPSNVVLKFSPIFCSHVTKATLLTIGIINTLLSINDMAPCYTEILWVYEFPR